MGEPNLRACANGVHKYVSGMFWDEGRAPHAQYETWCEDCGKRPMQDLARYRDLLARALPRIVPGLSTRALISEIETALGQFPRAEGIEPAKNEEG